jgi:hypothetical protein
MGCIYIQVYTYEYNICNKICLNNLIRHIVTNGDEQYI